MILVPMLRKRRTSPFRNLFHSLAALWVAVAVVKGQTPWRSTLYPANWQPPNAAVSFASAKLIQDFSYAGYRRGEELLPAITGPVFDVTAYGADPTGASDSTLAIQSAINAAADAGGGVVFLPAGEFLVSPQGTSNHCLRISSSNVVLRGAGVAQTFLLNTSYSMRGKSVIQVSPSSSPSLGTARNITANLPGPTHRIPVENAGAFARGNIVRLQWNFTSDWVTENKQQTWWGDSRPGSALYYREVVAVDANAGWIEVDVPTRYWIKTRESPTVRTVSGLLRNIGIESLSIGNLQHPGSGWGEEDYSDAAKAAYDTHNSWLVRIQNVRDSWITAVRSRQAAANTRTCHMLSNGILLANCLRLTVQDCQMRRPQYGGGGGNGYMYRLQNSNECLVRNSLAEFSRHGFVISHGGTSGNVFLQCEDRETGRATGSSSSGYTTDGAGSDNHQYFSHSNLWDQCHVHNSFFTAHHRAFYGGTPPHGVTSAHAVYWNTSGSGTRYDSSGAPIVRSEQLNYGYVIGTRATSGSAYSASNPNGGNTAPADHLEGIGTGATLQPASLYLDQLSRRLRPVIAFNSNGGSTAAPASIQVVFGATYGPLPSTSRPGYSFTGWFTAPTGGNLVTTETTVTNSADHTLHARWNALPSVDAGPDQSLASTLPVPWSPAGISTAAWFDAADSSTLTANAGTVSLWQDKSGNQNHAAQTTASRRPASGSATIGGLNAVAFDPFKDQHLAAPHHASLNLDASGGANLFAVFHSAGYVNRSSGLNSIVSKGALLSAGATYGIRVNDNHRLPYKAGDNWFSTPGEDFTSQDLIYSGTRDDSGRTATAFINGLALSSAAATAISSNNTSPLVLGGETTLSRCADVRLGEFLIVPGLITEGNRQRIEGYLAHKWALASKLPADHLYKTSPPTDVASTTLAGTASDPENDPLAASWSMVSGPGPVTFSRASAGNTTATFPLAGSYVLRLTANDGLGSRSDEVVITVENFVPPDPFVQWAGTPDASFMHDANADGLADGLAWLLGAASPETRAATVLPLPRQENGALSVTFNSLIPANRGPYSMRLQHSSTVAPDSWTDVEIPDVSGTVNGVEFFITPLPDGKLHQIKAVVPAGPAGRVFVRLAATVPGS
jgi:uncharacterized repeat protein (TIGR02543 family)